MEKKFNLMIIDDDWSIRKQVYLTVLSPVFNIIPIENPKDLFVKIEEEEEVDGYLIDIVLGGNWQNSSGNPQELIPVLERIGGTKPIFLVSREYATLLEEDKLTLTINAIIEKGISINSFFLWQEFEKEAYFIDNPEPDNSTSSIQSSILVQLLQSKKEIAIQTSKKADIAVVCALSEELMPFEKLLSDPKQENFEKIRVVRGSIQTLSGKEIRIVVAQQNEMGTVDASVVGTTLIDEFAPKHLIMIGVCGGREKKVKIGDLIIPNEVIAYQKGKIGENGLEMNLGIARSNSPLKSHLEGRCNDILQEIFSDFSGNMVKKGKSLGVERPGLHFDEMACGENVINKPDELEEIAIETKKPKMRGVDMESYAILRLHEYFEVKTCVIKSVMDLTSNKNDSYKEYAAFVAAQFLFKIIKNELFPI